MAGRKEIKKALRKLGATGEIELFFWKGDGWYCQCDQLGHVNIGLNSHDVLRGLKCGEYDRFFRKEKEE